MFDNYQVLSGPVDAQIFGVSAVSTSPAVEYGTSLTSAANSSVELTPYVETSTPLEERGDGTAQATSTSGMIATVSYGSTAAAITGPSSTTASASLAPASVNTISTPWTLTGSVLPTKFVLPFRGEVFNQGQANNSPLLAVKSLKAQQEFKEHRTYYAFNDQTFYASVKAVDTIPQEGSTLEASVGVLTSYGYLADPEVFKLDDPFPFPVTASYKMANLSEIKDAVFSGRPTALGIEVDEGFRSAFGSVIPEPSTDIPVVTEGHAVVVYGWDDSRECGSSTGALYVKNSWGKDWGENGFAWLPYTHLSTYMFDAWCVDDTADVIP